MDNHEIALIIEDDEDIAEIFDQALTSSGFATELIYDGAVAQKRLAEAVPHLVVLDIHLPNVSGQSLIKQIRDDQRLNDTIILVATADAMAADFDREQADFVLVKPISYSQLRDLTARLHNVTHAMTEPLGLNRIVKGGLKPQK